MNRFMDKRFVRCAWIGFAASLLVIPASYVFYGTVSFLTLMVCMMVGFLVTTTIYLARPKDRSGEESRDLLLFSCAVWTATYAWVWPGLQELQRTDIDGFWWKLLHVTLTNVISYVVIYIALLVGSLFTIGFKDTISRKPAGS